MTLLLKCLLLMSISAQNIVGVLSLMQGTSQSWLLSFRNLGVGDITTRQRLPTHRYEINLVPKGVEFNFGEDFRRKLTIRRVEFPFPNSKMSFALHKSSAATVSSGQSESNGNTATNKDQSLNNLNILFMRCSWVSWWVQIVLSVISGVILTFANTVRVSGAPKSLWASGFSFSVIGVILSFVNTFWTWNVTRLNRRIQQQKIEKIKVLPTIRRYAQMAVAISLCGMAVTLLGAEQIVGTLASKVLLTQSFASSVTFANQNSLQALDIFLVQANTNVLIAHFAPLLCYITLQTQLVGLGTGTSSVISQTVVEAQPTTPEK